MSAVRKRGGIAHRLSFLWVLQRTSSFNGRGEVEAASCRFPEKKAAGSRFYIFVLQSLHEIRKIPLQ
jgi:hypothetical protein